MSQSTTLAEEILLRLSARGVELWLEAGALRFRAPRDAMDDAARREVAENREAIISLLSQTEAVTAPPRALEVNNEIAELFSRLDAIDVRVRLDGEKLSVSAPKGVVAESMRNELAARKSEIIAYLKAIDRRAILPPEKSIAVVSRDQDFALSHSQQRLWFIRQMDPGSYAYNIPIVVRLKGRLDVDALEQTLNDLIARHESLRTRFISIDGVPRCAIEARASAVLERVDLTHLPESERETSAIDAAMRVSQRTHDLSRPPLLITLLIRVAPDEHISVSVFDHIVADGLSLGIFFNDFRSLYSKHIGVQAEALPNLPVQFIDYVEWERRGFEDGAQEQNLAFWKEQLRGAPSFLQLPTDRPRPAIQTSNGSYILMKLPATLSGRLKVFARKHNATLFIALMSAFQVLLHRYSGETDIVVGTAVANRSRPEVERVFGFFANNIMLRGDLKGDPTLPELMARTRDTALKAYSHQQMPFDSLVDALAVRRELNHSPVFQVMLVLHDGVPKSLEMPGLTWEAVELPGRTARLDLAVDISDSPDELTVSFEYNTDLFDAATIERMQRQFVKLLEEFLERPQARISELAMLSVDERDHILVDFNETSCPVPVEQTVHGMFEAQASCRPNATAVLFEGAATSYDELNKRANKLAHHLGTLGVGLGSLVGIWMDRSVNMIVALLGVLKSGAAYVPLDPAFPKERLAFMMADADVKVIVTEEALAQTLAGDQPHAVCLDSASIDLMQSNDANPSSAVSSRDLAYVIYTSGSTGLPKGVLLEHHSVVNFLLSMQVEPGISASDRFVAVTTLSFDIAGLEIFGPLTAGGTVVLAPRATALDGARLADLLQSCQATILQATPATWRLLIDSGWRGQPNLKIICGGEALPRDLADRLLGLGSELWNMYGPTETTIWSTAWKVTSTARSIPIGRPIANTQVYVLDASDHPAPIGVAGELCIGGDGLARGYRNRPELTAEKFVSLSLPIIGETRVYRTGDMVRFLADGSLDFIGRRDHQVKVRGFRIELGEIEAVLATCPGIKENVVIVREDVPGDQRLVAYVVTTGEMAFDVDAARATLRVRLPEYMVPNNYVALTSLPLTPNGKIDRKALPLPTEAINTPNPNENAVLTPVQRKVVQLWQSILKQNRIGLHDNFFDLGGHSLLLVKLQSGLQREFGSTFPLVELFQRTTVATQAERLGDAPQSSDGALKRARARAEKQARLHG